LALLALVSQVDLGFEERISAARAALRHQAASGEIVLVEIDAASLARLHSWPWPRTLYARALERLVAAHVRSVGFDVDFSAPSDAIADQAFALALKRAGGSVYLPTFRQQSGFGGGAWIDSIPIPALRDASFLAAVNVFPDANGVVTTYPFSVTTHSQPRPSIAAMLAETDTGQIATFRIDYAIDPSTLPRVSFADLLENKVDPSRLRGKRILIGATAIELGDRYAAPNYGVIPGVVIQALAGETLLRNHTPRHVDAVIPLLFALATIWLAAGLTRPVRVAAAGAGTVLLLAGPLVIEPYGVTVATVPALATLIASLLGEAAGAIGSELRRRRFTDPASGLPNRLALEAAAQRQTDAALAVASFSSFHELSTALGREQSAALLGNVATAAAGAVRAEIYRVDEGAIAWLEPTVPDDRDGHFMALATALRYTANIQGITVDLTPTFGVSTTAGLGVSEAVSGALIAAYRARAEGVRWRSFVADEGAEQRQRLSLLGELSHALTTGEIWVAYQPKFGLAERRIVGAEALIRWRHPIRGAIGPDTFIPLFEQEGRALELTSFVLDRALSDLAAWRHAGAEIGIAVNVSATLLEDPALVPMVEAALGRHSVTPAAITLELTESAIMSQSQTALDRLQALRGLGVGLSIDDYGTGQSTLSYLRNVPASELKIDKSFIQSIGTSLHDKVLVRSTIELAHALDLKVVAEGVEDEATQNVLVAMGCDIVQGWHTGRPMPAEDFAAIVARPHALAA
jgi:EAL domain-containing protein (putative c-di-GMP-specific phosphodiesterase class I)/CHASE2 domain-containing sensor protein/GGDEF domain-containing protein